MLIQRVLVVVLVVVVCARNAVSPLFLRYLLIVLAFQLLLSSFLSLSFFLRERTQYSSIAVSLFLNRHICSSFRSPLFVPFNPFALFLSLSLSLSHAQALLLSLILYHNIIVTTTNQCSPCSQHQLFLPMPPMHSQPLPRRQLLRHLTLQHKTPLVIIL